MKLKVYPGGKAEIFIDQQENILLCYGYVGKQKNEQGYSEKLNEALVYFGVDNQLYDMLN